MFLPLAAVGGLTPVLPSAGVESLIRVLPLDGVEGLVLPLAGVEGLTRGRLGAAVVGSVGAFVFCILVLVILVRYFTLRSQRIQQRSLEGVLTCPAKLVAS